MKQRNKPLYSIHYKLCINIKQCRWLQVVVYIVFTDSDMPQSPSVVMRRSTRNFNIPPPGKTPGI